MTDTAPSTRPEPPPEGAYPGLGQALLLMAGVVLLQVVFAELARLAAGATGLPLDQSPAGVAVVNLLAFGCVLAWGLRATRASFSAVFPFRGFRLTYLAPMTALILGSGIVFSEIDNLFRTFFPIPDEIAKLMTDLTASDTSVWVILFLLVVVAPFTEELFFRGLLLRGFVRRYGKLTAVLASGLLFGIMHLNPWQFIATSVAGAVLAWWAVETRSLWPCIYGHALNNSLPVLVSRLGGFEIRGFTGGTTGPVEFQPVWFDVLGAVLAGWGIAVLVRGFERDRAARSEA